MSFPTDIQATTYFQEAYNNLSTTLSQICGVSDTTVYVASTANFPSIGWITMEDEIRAYTGKTAGSFTGCTPGSDGTTAAEHAAGKAVSLTLPAIAWNHTIAELRAALTKIGVNSSAVTTSHDYKLSTITGTDKAVSKTGTETLTNKCIIKREITITSSATPTPNSDITDIYTITALAEAATFGAPTGTPTQGQTLLIRIKDNATARALSFNAIYRAGTDIALPTTTVLSKTIYIGFVYNSTSTKWDLILVVDNI